MADNNDRRVYEEITIGKNTYKIYELIVDDIFLLLNEFDLGLKDIKNQSKEAAAEKWLMFLHKWLPRVTDIPLEDFKKFHFSEIQKGWEVFKKINAPFFWTLEKLEMGRPIIAAIQELLKILPPRSPASSKPGTKTFGDTVTGFLRR